MSIFSRPRAIAIRGLAVLQSVGTWVTIHPEQTYVATSISGLGACKSAYCPAIRRELPKRTTRRSRGLSKAVALAAVVLLSGCVPGRQVRLADVTDRGHYERDLADCQILAAPVSPGAAVSRGLAVEATALVAASGEGAMAVDAAPFGVAAGSASGADSNLHIVSNRMTGRGFAAFD